jgi:hypothetical protein
MRPKFIAVFFGSLGLIALGIYLSQSNGTRVIEPTPPIVESASASHDSTKVAAGSHRGVSFTPRVEMIEEDWKPTPIDLEKIHDVLPASLQAEHDVLSISNFLAQKRAAEAVGPAIVRPDELQIPVDASPEVEMHILGRKADANAQLAASLAGVNDCYSDLKASIGPEKYALFRKFERVEELADKLSMLEERQKAVTHRAAASVLLEIAEESKGTFDERRNDLTGTLGPEYVRVHEDALRYWSTDRIPRGKLARRF